MISSLKSKFEFANRRALLLSANKAAIYHWQNGDIGSSYLFDVDEEGQQQFERYLRETAKSPVYMLVDVFEEEFRHETIPHVFGADRISLIDRKQNRLFRDTHYRFYKIEGREEAGRRDDRVLLTGITNPSLIDPWVAMLDKYKVPLAGIQSLPLITESALKPIIESSKHVLIVSLQSISGLRQTFFSNKEFKISRLVQMPRYGTQPYAPYIAEEVEKIRRYLGSLRVMSDDQLLDIYFLATGELLEELKSQHVDEGSVRYHVLDVNELLASAGSKKVVSTPFSNQFFVQHLLRRRPDNCYASSANMRYSTMRRMRYWMLAASLLLVLGTVIWGGFKFMGGLTLKQQSIAAESKFQFYTTRYQMAKERLLKTPVEPVDLKIAVELADRLSAYKTSPLALVQVVSKGLDSYPTLKLENIKWQSSTDPNLKTGDKQPTNRIQNEVGFSDVSFADTGYRYYQIGTISGRLDPFDGNYRTAISTINQFVEKLREQNSVHDASIVTLPLDLSSSASMQGTTQIEAKEANFSIRLVIGIGDEA